MSTGTYTSIVKTLALSCRGSSQLVVSLLDQGIIDTVHGIIRKEEDAELSGTALMTVVAVQRPVEQLLHTLVLANELLPPVEGDDDTCQCAPAPNPAGAGAGGAAVGRGPVVRARAEAGRGGAGSSTRSRGARRWRRTCLGAARRRSACATSRRRARRCWPSTRRSCTPS